LGIFGVGVALLQCTISSDNLFIPFDHVSLAA